MALSDLVDLDRYPVDRPDSEDYSSLIGRARQELADDGICVLEGFVRPDAIDRILPQLDAVEEFAFHALKHHNVYLRSDDPQFDEDHPRNAKQTTTSATLGYDHARTVEELEGLYRSDEIRSFVAAALGHDVLYPYEDTLAPVSVLFYPPASQLGWHVDNSIFTVTIMLREAVGGAEFEYVPFLLDGDDLAFDRVAEIVAGGRRWCAVAGAVAGDTGVVQRQPNAASRHHGDGFCDALAGDAVVLARAGDSSLGCQPTHVLRT